MMYDESGTVYCQGDWTVNNLAAFEGYVAALTWPRNDNIVFDGSKISRLDTAGSWLLYRTSEQLRKGGRHVSVAGLVEDHASIFNLVASHPAYEPDLPPDIHFVEKLGKIAFDKYSKAIGFLSFIGKTSTVAVRAILSPGRIRWQDMAANIESAGVNALPIIGLLTFLIGVVIAYQGGAQLKQFGATIFIADIVGLSMTREFAPLITAILVAGRTGSAYTARISTMQVTEEIDAMKVLGIEPIELLVLPKLAALLIVMPLLTLYADIMGILGGMLMAGQMLDVSSTVFLQRLPDALTMESFMIGIGKAPVFASIIVMVGCYQGFLAKGSAESVGEKTTVSVVLSIFLVIIADAAFSVLFSWIGI